MDQLSGRLRMLKSPKMVAQRSPPPTQSSSGSPTLENETIDLVVPISLIKRRTLRKRPRSSASTPPVSPRMQYSLSPVTPTSPSRGRSARDICNISSPQLLGIPQAFVGLEDSSSFADHMVPEDMQDESVGTAILDKFPVPPHALTTPNVRTDIPVQSDSLPIRRNFNQARELTLDDPTMERWLQRRNEEAVFAPGSPPARQRIQRSLSNASFSQPSAIAYAGMMSPGPVSGGSSSAMPKVYLDSELQNRPEVEDEADDWTLSAQSSSESPLSSLLELPNYSPYHPDILRVVRGPAYMDALEAARRPDKMKVKVELHGVRGTTKLHIKSHFRKYVI